MKKLQQVILTSAIALSTFSFSSVANMSPQVENALKDVCKTITENRPVHLRKTVSGYNLNIEIINQKLMCNNESAFDFANTHGADKNARVLNRGSVEIKDIANIADSEKFYVYVD